LCSDYLLNLGDNHAVQDNRTTVGRARWAISLRSVQELPAVPDLKKVTADASGFVALTPEGMAGTSQDLPAAEAAAAGVLPCSSAFVVRSDI
jgi:hypothetical protein